MTSKLKTLLLESQKYRIIIDLSVKGFVRVLPSFEVKALMTVRSSL